MQKYGITFTIEDIEKASSLLPEKPFKEIAKIFSKKIEKHYLAEQPLVSYDTHSFIQGMHQAYADHRPFVLSPDMIWLLICQGFAMHVNANAEKLRPMFVDFQGKKELIARNDTLILGQESPWEEIFPEFTKQIRAYVGNEIVNTLSADFSTTTLTEKIASEITILYSFKPYFEYIVMLYICGIPQVTLEGSPEDWEKIVEKAKHLRKYDLDWWIDELIPILNEFVKTSKGEINISFWQSMFKVHTLEVYGNPKMIDGWVLKLYPYDKDGYRLEMQMMNIEYIKELPSEIVKVDFKYQIFDDSEGETKLIAENPMEFLAGFVGLKQDHETLALRPEIGWLIAHKDISEQKITANRFESLVFRNIEEIPDTLFELKEIYELTIYFVKTIRIPDKMKDIQIHHLLLVGQIDDKEKQRVVNLLKNVSYLDINDEHFSNEKADWKNQAKSYFDISRWSRFLFRKLFGMGESN